MPRFHAISQILNLVLASTVCASSFIFDDFSAGPVELIITEAHPFLSFDQKGLLDTAVAGGIRRHLIGFNHPIAPKSDARIVVDTDALTWRVTTNASLEPYRLTYGRRTIGEGPPGEDLNLDLSGFSAFRFDVGMATIPAEINFTAVSSLSDPSRKSKSAQLTLPASETPYSFVVPFSVFSPEVDFSDLDGFRLSSLAPPGLDLELRGIFIVPEPSGGVLLLVAIGVAMNQFLPLRGPGLRFSHGVTPHCSYRRRMRTEN